MDNKKYTKDDAYQTLNLINSWINNVDTKISFALAFVSVLIGFVFVNGSSTVFIKLIETNKLSLRMIMDAIIITILYASSFISIIYMFLAIKARTSNISGKKSVLFFGTIAKTPLNDFKAKILNMNEKELTKDLLEQIHTNSVICTKKMRLYNIGIIYLIISTSLCFVAVVLDII